MRVCWGYAAATPTGDTVQCSTCKIPSAYPYQWRYRRGAGGSLPPPPHPPTPRLLTGKFLLTYGEKKRQGKMGKRGENWEKKKENCKREGGKLKTEGGKVTKWGEDLFFFFFFFWLVTKICFGVYQMEIFYREKAFCTRKKTGKITLPPRKFFLLCPWPLQLLHFAAAIVVLHTCYMRPT